MSEVTIPYIADSSAILKEIRTGKNMCCKICLERGFDHNSYAATRGLRDL
jgi:hypothetical protein